MRSTRRDVPDGRRGRFSTDGHIPREHFQIRTARAARARAGRRVPSSPRHSRADRRCDLLHARRPCVGGRLAAAVPQAQAARADLQPERAAVPDQPAGAGGGTVAAG